MNFDNKFTDTWRNEGVEPSSKLKQSGFTGGYKPPATVFNWFIAKTMKAITEIQQKAAGLRNSGMGEVFNDYQENVASGSYAHAEGKYTTASAGEAHAEGYGTTASGNYAHAEGFTTTASGTYASHAEGRETLAEESYAHAEGLRTTASGMSSHAEGNMTTAGGLQSHVEGNSTNKAKEQVAGYTKDTDVETIKAVWNENRFALAHGENSHVEGRDCLALGANSHAEGTYTVAEGIYAHAEGMTTTANAQYASHAEGRETIASGNYSHAEGRGSKTTGTNSHAEGGSTLASGEAAHAEGTQTQALGAHSHAEGHLTTASGDRSHAEGSSTERATEKVEGLSKDTDKDTVYKAWKTNKEFMLAHGTSSHVEGSNNIATGTYAHAEGYRNAATGSFSHAEGQDTLASGEHSHAEGLRTTASGNCAHASGESTTASGEKSRAWGWNCTASEENATAFGNKTTASGRESTACGNNTKASGQCAVARGYYTNAQAEFSEACGYYTKANAYQFVAGKYNAEKAGATAFDDQSADSSIFIIGFGTDETHANAMRITAAGKCLGSSAFVGSGADFAEYFEWVDGNPDNEDRRGLFVTLDGEKIRPATSDDDYILGVVSVAGAFIGNSASEFWQGMYLKDVFGENITEQVEVPEKFDEETGETIPAHTVTKFVVNPEYDSQQEYISREFRKEWAPVGFHGQVIVVDDGSCQVNGYCIPSINGTGTAAENGYRVMSRIDDTHIKILVR